MGIALYKRPQDGAVFAIVSPKVGGQVGRLWQYHLHDDGRGRVAGTLVRRFGAFGPPRAMPTLDGEIEALVVDDELGYVYYSDERLGIRKWYADPNHPQAENELAVFGTQGYVGDREGLAIYVGVGGRGYIISADQIPARTRLHVYPREGGPGGPHDHPRLAVIETAADDTDGLDVTSTSAGPFSRGLLVMMNSASRNFLVFDWKDVDAAVARSIRTR
jgi:3-phytase